MHQALPILHKLEQHYRKKPPSRNTMLCNNNQKDTEAELSFCVKSKPESNTSRSF